VLDRQLLIVTGKGGVGKSTVAAGLAWSAAAAGKRVLAVALDQTGQLDTCLAGASPRPSPVKPVGYAPQEREPGLFSMEMDPEESLKEYLRIFLKLPVVTKIGLLSNIFDFVANAAPGVREIVTVGKFTYEVRERNYDLVVVDATATGHVTSQLDAPSAINQLVGSGLIRNQTEWMREILTDATKTGVVAVTTSEEMPVVETIELLSTLKDLSVDVAGVVVNRVREEPLSRRDWIALEAAIGPNRSGLDALLEGSFGPLVASARHISDHRRLHEPHLHSLLQAVAQLDLASAAVAFLPWLPHATPGPAFTTQIAELLNEEFDLVEAARRP
jgi:anion-transporting  ArsA/GET3 family ATPase